MDYFQLYPLKTAKTIELPAIISLKVAKKWSNVTNVNYIFQKQRQLFINNNHIVANNMQERIQSPPTEETCEYTWRLLQVFSLYRCFLAATLLFLKWLEVSLLGKTDKVLFVNVIAIYLGASLISTTCAFLRTIQYHNQVVLQIFLDILVITLMMHASGGVLSGLSVLLIPVIAAACILAPGKISFLYTAMATIAILSEQIFAKIHNSFDISFTIAGLSGITLFATAITVNFLSRQLIKSEELSKKQTAALEKLEQLSILILQKLHTGVLVIDEYNKLSMINNAASNIINSNMVLYGTHISLISEVILKTLENWRSNKLFNNPTTININNKPNDISIEFIPLAKDNNGSVLLFLEDITGQAKKMQEMKLVSVGRLTASIAHEIRNPLGAISHAVQLLSESDSFRKCDYRLLDIIQENAKRTNSIIENILTLSKTKTAIKKTVSLTTYLNKFVNQFVMTDYQNLDINLEIIPKKIKIIIDPSQLQQILTNLCENGIRYSMQNTNTPYLLIKAGIEEGTPFLDVIDKGPGISSINAKYLFEPFFTTENTGTGLGLFVAHELCQANGIKLSFYSIPTGGSRFRLLFPLLQESVKNEP